jgi:hypothetical protein
MQAAPGRRRTWTRASSWLSGTLPATPSSTPASPSCADRLRDVARGDVHLPDAAAGRDGRRSPRLVAAAGNDLTSLEAPATADGATVVTALDLKGRPAPYCAQLKLPTGVVAEQAPGVPTPNRWAGTPTEIRSSGLPSRPGSSPECLRRDVSPWSLIEDLGVEAARQRGEVGSLRRRCRSGPGPPPWSRTSGRVVPSTWSTTRRASSLPRARSRSSCSSRSPAPCSATKAVARARDASSLASPACSWAAAVCAAAC